MSQDTSPSGLNIPNLYDLIIDDGTCIYFCSSCGSTNIKYNKAVKMDWLSYLICCDCGGKCISKYFFPAKLPTVENVYSSRYIREGYLVNKIRNR